MGRIRKHKLSWKPSGSCPVVGYRLYWSNETPVSYDSNFIKLGNIIEVNLPDILLGVAPSEGSFNLGISALDEAGNESDIIFLPESYHLSVPSAPVDLVLTTLDDFKITEPKIKAENQVQDKQKPNSQQTDQEIRLNSFRTGIKSMTTEGKNVDDINYWVRKALED